MTIKIIKCSSPFSWYNQKIGEIYQVYENTFSDFYIFGDRIISKSDAYEVNELRKLKLQTI